MLDREGARGPADVAVVGSRSEVQAVLRRSAAIGVTDFCGAPVRLRRPGFADSVAALAGMAAQLKGRPDPQVGGAASGASLSGRPGCT